MQADKVGAHRRAPLRVALRGQFTGQAAVRHSLAVGPSRTRTRAPGQPICPRCPTRFARRSGAARTCPAGLEPASSLQRAHAAQLAAASAGRADVPKRQPARRRSGGRAATRACPAMSLLRSPLRPKCLRKSSLLRAPCSRHVACPSQASCPNLLLSATWKDKAFS